MRPNKKNDGEKDPLNGWRRDRKHLCVPMAPEHVREIEDRWPPVGASVENGKQCLEEAIQVYSRNYVAAKLQQIVARVPPVMKNACRQDYSAPSGTTIFSPPTRAPRVPAFTMPSSRSRTCTCKGGPSALGGSVPSRYRTIRPAASRLRCIRKISPLRRFSNVRKLSTSHPHLRPMRFENNSYGSYHWARQLAANRSPKRSGSYYPGLLALRKLAGQKCASGEVAQPRPDCRPLVQCWSRNGVRGDHAHVSPRVTSGLSDFLCKQVSVPEQSQRTQKTQPGTTRLDIKSIGCFRRSRRRI